MNTNAKKRFSILAPIAILFVCVFALSCSDKEGPIGGKYYTITFDARNGSPSIDPMNVGAGTKITKPTDPEKDGFGFVGWYKDSGLATPFSFEEIITQNIILYAKYMPIPSYDVKFDVDGGSIVNTQRIDSGKKASAPADPTKENFIFNGWYANKTFATSFIFEKNPIVKETTIYAKWRRTAVAANKTISAIISEGKMPQDIIDNVLSKYPPNAALSMIYLKPNGSSENGVSWSDAAGNLKTVIDNITDASASKVYLVLLAAGEYKAKTTFSMKNHVAIAGGFKGDADEDYTAGDTTTLSGEGSYQVISNSGIDSSAVLYRLKITNGVGNSGGGMININSSPKLTNIRFAGNSTTGNGGGMANYNSSPSLENVSFAGNFATGNGGGMDNYNSFPSLENVSFAGNSATINGGGMDNYNSSPSLENVSFAGNSATINGGGMANYNSSPSLKNVSFAGNSAAINGGGMANDTSSPSLENVSFAYNSASDGGGMYNYSNSAPILINVNFDGNNASSYGGGMANAKSSSIVLANVSFAYNSATTAGGGIDNFQSSLLVVNSIFWGNTVENAQSSTNAQITLYNNSTIRLYHSILQGSKEEVVGNTAGIRAYVDMDSTDPVLSPLANNGGFVSTIAIGAGSSAINKGLYAKRSGTDFYFSTDKASWFTINDDGTTNDNVPLPANTEDLTATDARGYGRVDRPDAGAYEYGGIQP